MARIITKGLIGAEDISFGTSTFTRSTSTGGTQTLHQVSGGAQLAAAADNTAQTANIGTTNLVSSASVGLYRVNGFACVTTAATSSSTLPSIIIAWTDADSSQAMTFTLTNQNTSNVKTAIESGFLVINAKASTAISYSTSGYATSGATSMKYSVHLRMEGPL